jgi:hypothetical protein
VYNYYYSAKLRITLRLEEFGQGSALAAVPPKTTKNLNGVKDQRAPLTPIRDPLAPEGVTRYLLQAAGQTAAQPATSYQRSADGFTYDVTIVPTQMTVSQNGVRTADTFTASFRYIDLPIDPRLVRSAAVECFLGTVNEEDFVAGIQGRTRPPDGSGNGLPLNVLEDTYVDSSGQQRTNSRFQGWVDEWKINWGESNSESVIEISGRDNTQLLIEQQASPKMTLDMSKPIDEAVALLLSHYPQMQGMSVQYLPTGLTPPILKTVLHGTAHRPKLGPQPAKAGGAAHKLSIWDYLTDVMGSIGHIIRIEGTTVILQLPRTLMTKNAARRPDDPFQGRTLSTGEAFDYRRLIYGKHLKSMNMVRKYAKGAPANIEVRCYVGEKKTTLVERFPEKADRAKFVIPGDAQPDTKWTVVRISGIGDKKTLKAVAQSYYESQNRNELQVEAQTLDLGSWGGGNDDPDLLDMRAGDTFEVLVNREHQDEASSITNAEDSLTSRQRNEAFMRNLGMSNEFAAAYAKAYTDAGFITQFRLKQMTMNWSIDSDEGGISLSIIGVNYIEVRLDKSQPDGEEPGTAPTDFTSNVPRTSVNKQ